MCVRVPHPDDESFQTFFKNEKLNTTTLPSSTVEDSYFDSNSRPLENKSEVNLGSITRNSDLLVMKKHMPLLRRKSSGKSKNPLKVLAARMDFKNQNYTETLSNVGQN